MPLQQPLTIALFAPQLKELLRRGAIKELRQMLSLISPLDLAEGWEALSEQERLMVFNIVARRKAVVLFEALAIEHQALLLEAFAAGRTIPSPPFGSPSGIAEAGKSTFTSGDPAPSGKEQVHLLLRSLSPRTLKKLNRFLSKTGASSPIHVQTYPPGTVGSLMRPQQVSLEPSLTARQALEKFQAVLRPGSGTLISTLFVVDPNGQLVSGVELRDLLAAPPDVKLSEVAMSCELIKLPAHADQEEAARLFDRFELAAAPVVDDAGQLIGTLSANDIIDVLKKEASEDIAKLAGTSADELQSRSVFRIVWLRMPWLLVTVAGGALVSVVIRNFEDTLRQLLALASFTPLIAAMGGNVGTQSSTIVVRGLATGEISESWMWRTAWRECRTGMVLGLLYGIFGGLAAYALYGRTLSLDFALVVGFAMFISMTLAATMGAMFPFILNRYGADPALATGPFISTSTDLLTTLLYLSVASAILL